MLLARHVADQALVARMDRAYEDGLIGSRDLTRWDMDVLPRDADLLRSEAAAVDQDETFVGFVAAVHGCRHRANSPFDTQPQPSTGALRLARWRAFR